MTTYLVTGANRGIGLELVKQLSSKPGAVVIGTTRSVAKLPADAGFLQGVRWVELDVSDWGSIESLPERLGGVDAIDVLINNAGVSSPARLLADVTGPELERVFRVNTFAPLLVTKALLPKLVAGSRKLVLNITSQLGSIANNTGGSSYAYRASKTGLNQLTVSLANELRPMGIACVMAHPGWVQTDMGGKEATLTPEVSVRGLVSIVDQAELSMSGRFLNYDGNPLPW
jgi:NAD(P)-dependent dehydrogenase (short-subunit alcohol dehydrogenase family)